MRRSSCNGPERSVGSRQHKAGSSQDMAQSSREKILVVQTSFLGDTVLTTPLLFELKRHFPLAELAVLCTPQAKGLLEDNSDIDEIIPYEKRKAGKKWVGLCRKAKELDRKSTRLNSSHLVISYAVFCLKKKKKYRLTSTCSARQRTDV